MPDLTQYDPQTDDVQYVNTIHPIKSRNKVWQRLQSDPNITQQTTDKIGEPEPIRDNMNDNLS